MSEKLNFQEEKKSHWQSYESKDRKDLRDIQRQEFFTSPDPVIQRIKTGQYDRRSFLKLMGASTAMLTVNCLPQNPEKIVPYVNKPEFMVPGLSNYYASSCGGCSAGCGILVKTKDGRPLKLEGNPSHPLNKGSICAQGQASILNLYDPDRAQDPLKISNGNGEKISWKDLDDAVKKALAENSGKTIVFSNPINSPGTKKIISEFLSKVGGGKHLEFDSTSPEEAIYLANEISYGKGIVPNYRFDKAKVILSLDADFLGTWISPIEYSKQFNSRRTLKGSDSSYNQLIMVDTMLSVTSSVADMRIPVRSDDLKRVGLAIAKAISNLGGSSFGQLESINVEAICKEIDVSVEKINSIAKLLWASKGESLVVGGGTASATKDAVDLQVIVNLINSQLDNDGKTVDSVAIRSNNAEFSKNLSTLISELDSGNVGVLFLYGVNPSYELPENSSLEKSISKAKLVVSLNDRLDETSKNANYLAPSNHFLESWGDRESVSGVVSIQQPTIKPIFATRSFEDSLINWAGGELSGSKSYYEYLKSTYSKITNWVDFLRGGVYGKADLISNRGARGFKGTIGPISQRANGLVLSLYTTVAMGDGSHANNPVLQELPDPITKVTWDNFIAIAPITAENRGIKSNDVLKVKVPSTGQELVLPAQVQPGMQKDVIAIALGYGRKAAGKVGNNVGKNAVNLAIFEGGKIQFSGMPVELEKVGKTYKLATTQEHHMMNPGSPLGTKWSDRPLIQHTNLVDYIKNPESGKAPPEFPMITDKTKSDKPFPSRGFNPEYEYKGYRWGMSIDLTSCTGCSACVVACHIENNIPVVGRDEVRVGREMHWIRIDRYYMGDMSKPENIEIGHQPVMCQHCENAPCETVCPVAATVHGSEGTNDMVYNRCVGTRYCSNNCPYKVRRYNWMEHWRDGKDMARSPRQLAFNPEVTVRSRGVMEKCTFCASRVAEKKIKAKNEGRQLKDGELKSACQETCPTDAISFGNINDKNSDVTMKSNDPRSYRILDFLNVKPQVAYLTRVRNYVKESV
jgi:Fe-S-cluster-containing dehydrogenase component/anaerobic selenocysteine-containing dehydrogenase